MLFARYSACTLITGLITVNYPIKFLADYLTKSIVIETLFLNSLIVTAQYVQVNMVHIWTHCTSTGLSDLLQSSPNEANFRHF